MPSKTISVKGARVHNLKNVSVSIPKEKLVVITGLSGSGKSSLAFDTIYAEGQRRYVESLSSYAKQFFGLLDKPDVDQIDGLSPTIAIDQKYVAKNPRSTVGTMTEIYDLFRLLFSKIGTPHCPHGHGPLAKKEFNDIVDELTSLDEETKLIFLSPIVKQKTGPYTKLFRRIKQSGYTWISVNSEIYNISEISHLKLESDVPHDISIIINHLQSEPSKDEFEFRLGDLKTAYLMDLLKTAFDLSNGYADIVDTTANELKNYSQFHVCGVCGFTLPHIEPRNFSFNSPLGACEDCSGLGVKHIVDPDLVMPNKSLTIAQGAIRPYARSSSQNAHLQILEAVAKEHGFSLEKPISELNNEDIDILLYGTGSKLYSVKGKREIFSGIIADIEERYAKKDSDYMRKEMGKYMREKVCPRCNGHRLKQEVLHITIQGKSISEFAQQSIEEILSDIQKLKFTKKKEKQIAEPIIKEVTNRLEHLIAAGLSYLSLDRSLDTVSGGELQRIRLSTQMSSILTGVTYVLDEPSVGLHQKDTRQLIEILKMLRDRGNSVLVVEHDEEIIRSSDYLIDMGPKAGVLGGEIVSEGTVKEVIDDKKSLTGAYLREEKSISINRKKKEKNKEVLKVIGASSHNLKNVDVDFPLGNFICVTGVSGSGKSSLVHDILAKALHKELFNAKDEPGTYKEIKGIEFIDKVITVDQSPIGRTPRSNPATYTGVFTAIRDLFTELPEAKIRGFQPGHFSFNVKGGGRCESCQGEGMVKIEMQFLSDVYVVCESCHGKRYNKEALDIYYKDHNISDVLEMTVQEAKQFFFDKPLIHEKLKVLEDVGLGYMRLGQPATNLSGGEAQRVKLATELSRRSTGKTIYILDEPTTGLHFEDIQLLLNVLARLVDKGNTVIVIEHNLDVIACSDHVIDLGPEGGPKGGRILATGTPSDIKKVKESFTGQCL